MYDGEDIEHETEHDDATAFDLGIAVRHEFPALEDHGPENIFADGAGGSQVHTNVISAVTTHMRNGAANLGGNYSTSEKCMTITRGAREAMSDFLNCNSDEIIFGHNTTTLVYHLAHSVRVSLCLCCVVFFLCLFVCLFFFCGSLLYFVSY